jgi:hypothetical protein
MITCGRCRVYNVVEDTDDAIYCQAPDCEFLLRSAKRKRITHKK